MRDFYPLCDLICDSLDSTADKVLNSVLSVTGHGTAAVCDSKLQLLRSLPHVHFMTKATIKPA
jgi:hypothetical protein